VINFDRERRVGRVVDRDLRDERDKGGIFEML